jgi:hypothetical protein
MTNDWQAKINSLRTRKKASRLEIFKKRFKNFNFKKHRKYLIATSIVVFLLFIFFLFKPVIGRSWLEYPLPLRGEIAWSYWQESFASECYGACLQERAMMEEIIIRAWVNDLNYWNKIIYQYFQNNNNNESKKSLVDLSLQVFKDNKVPDIWINLVYNNQIDDDLKHYIIARFPLYFSADKDLFIVLAKKVINQSLTIEERVSSLKALSSWFNRETLDFCLNVIFLAKENILKIEAIQIINTWPIENIPITENDLDNLANLALKTDLGLELRPRLVWLLTDYYSFFPEKISFYLEEIYLNEELDVFSRGFSADSLNRLAGFNLDLPETSQADWDLYYSIY